MSEAQTNEIGLRHKIIGACAGSLVTAFAVNPFDVARVRMQQRSAVDTLKPASDSLKTERKSFRANMKPHSFSPQTISSFNGSNTQLGVTVCCKDAFWYPSSINYCVAADSDPCVLDTAKAARTGNSHSTFGVLSGIVKNEGSTVLWRGVSLSLVQAIPANIVYFIAYEHLRDSFTEVGNSFLTQTGPLLAGGLARALSSSIVSPLELLKTRLQSIEVSKNESAMAVALKSIRDMIKIDGYRSLWSGLGLTLWRDVPFSSIYWLVVEAVRSRTPKRTHSNAEKFAESFISGMVGGIAASVVTTPFDVAKTRRQIGSPSCASAHMSMARFMGTIARTEGWRALFVGLTPRTFKVAPACAIMITSYEMGKRILTS